MLSKGCVLLSCSQTAIRPKQTQGIFILVRGKRGAAMQVGRAGEMSQARWCGEGWATRSRGEARGQGGEAAGAGLADGRERAKRSEGGGRKGKGKGRKGGCRFAERGGQPRGRTEPIGETTTVRARRAGEVRGQVRGGGAPNPTSPLSDWRSWLRRQSGTHLRLRFFAFERLAGAPKNGGKKTVCAVLVRKQPERVAVAEAFGPGFSEHLL